MPIEIPPVVATNPVVQSPVEAKTFDTWFLTDFRLVATPERKFDAEVFWALGRIITLTQEVPVEKTVEKTVSKPKLDETGSPVLDENGEPVMEDVVETVTETVMETVTTNSSELSDTRRNCYVRDLLGDAQLAKHPEILQVLPGFLSALEAISKREGSI
jgi:hypothetical protein